MAADPRLRTGALADLDGVPEGARQERAGGGLALGQLPRFAHLAEESLAEQRRIEAGDKVDFETFRQQYLSPDLLRV